MVRNLLYMEGYNTEVLSTFHGDLGHVQEWWKQLFGESEGKEGKGIFPASCRFTTDLHSLGQYLQDGRRELFETFLIVDRSDSSLKVPAIEGGDGDGLVSGDGAGDETGGEGLALVAGHGDEQAAVVGLVDLVDGADVWMVEGRGGAGLVGEAGLEDRVADEFGREEFEGDLAVETGVAG